MSVKAKRYLESITLFENGSFSLFLLYQINIKSTTPLRCNLVLSTKAKPLEHIIVELSDVLPPSTYIEIIEFGFSSQVSKKEDIRANYL